MDGVLLTHGAGSDRNAPLLVALDRELTGLGYLVERVDLYFRASGKKGPPMPAAAAADRDGLREQLKALRKRFTGKLVMAGHSYGGRQGSMLLAETPEFADALVLLSYPLHPPGKPAQLRTAHFPALRTPSLFVSGDRDEFGTPEELSAALALIPARKEIEIIKSAGHDLKRGSAAAAIADRIHRFLL